jgi:predicted MPP superfamily phosphohydrolase
MLNARINRRHLLRGGFYASVAAVVADTFWFEPHWLEIVKREMNIRDLPEDWRGKTLLQISDIHVGPQVDDDYILNCFEAAKELKPDIVVYTGDFVSVTKRHPVSWEQIRRVYEHAPQGKLDTLAILGNHDYTSDGEDYELSRLVVTELREFGINFLLNESKDVDGLRIGGLEDLWSGKCKVDSVVQKPASELPHIVLCHNPDGADLPQWQKFQGWILAGHTHGGQCKAPFLPPPLLPVENRRYTAGYFDLYDGRQMYINRGLGHLLPVRFNCRPEITLFTLT